LQRAGFALPVADAAKKTVTYATAFHLIADLRAMGEGNALQNRSRRATPRALFPEAARIYAEAYPGDDGRIAATFKSAGVHRIHVVRGYKKDAVALPGLHYVDNDRYADTGELHSLALALETLGPAEGTLFVSYGDVLFRRHSLELLVENEADLAIVVDTNWKESANLGRDADLVRCSSPPSRRSFSEPVVMRRMARDLVPEECHGEWIGLLKVGSRARSPLQELTAEILASSESPRPQVSQLLNRMVDSGLEVQVVFTAGNWLDVDSLYDVIQANQFKGR